jgi:hypothetical protein
MAAILYANHVQRPCQFNRSHAEPTSLKRLPEREANVKINPIAIDPGIAFSDSPEPDGATA